MGHALSYKILTRKGSIIYMSHTSPEALTDNQAYKESKTKMAIVFFSGHLFTFTVGSMLFLGTFCLPASKAYIVSTTMLVKHFLRLSIFQSLFFETTYAVSSVADKNGDGDFSVIRRCGMKYAITFGVILSSILASTVMASFQLIKPEYEGLNMF